MSNGGEKLTIFLLLFKFQLLSSGKGSDQVFATHTLQSLRILNFF